MKKKKKVNICVSWDLDPKSRTKILSSVQLGTIIRLKERKGNRKISVTMHGIPKIFIDVFYVVEKP